MPSKDIEDAYEMARRKRPQQKVADTTTNDAFGQRIRTAMAVSRITGARLAAECGVSRQAVHKWEVGTAAPSSAHLMKFCDLTGCSVEWLLDPTPLDIRSTLRAPDGVHAKALIRQVIEDMASDGVLRVAAVSGE